MPRRPLESSDGAAIDGIVLKQTKNRIIRRGLELAAIAGAMLAAGALRRPVVLDGFAVGVVALAAVRLAPALREHLIAGHRSAEPAHDAVLTELGLEPLLDMRLRLGEASGAALARNASGPRACAASRLRIAAARRGLQAGRHLCRM